MQWKNFPESGRIISEFRDLPFLEAIISPYRIFYKIKGDMVWIDGRKWKWTDKQYCKGRLEPILRERTVSVESPFLETLKLAVIDRSPIVRRVAGETLIRELKLIGAESIKLAELLTSDVSPSVAERGRFALDRLKNQI